jgi:hypothetical protein
MISSSFQKNLTLKKIIFNETNKEGAFEIMWHNPDTNNSEPILGFLADFLIENLPGQVIFPDKRERFGTTTIPRDVAYYGSKVRALRFLSSYIPASIVNPQSLLAFLLYFFSSVVSFFNYPVQFNCSLIQRYKNEKDSMDLHADNEVWIGANKTILNLSLGDERTLSLQRNLSTIRTTNTRQTKVPYEQETPLNVDYVMKNGSAILFYGESFQFFFLHGVSKETDNKATRYSFNFRQHLSLAQEEEQKEKMKKSQLLIPIYNFATDLPNSGRKFKNKAKTTHQIFE